MLRRGWIMLIVGIGLLGCTDTGSESAPETPHQAIREIIGLYENQDFEALIRTRYAEISKAAGDEQVAGLVERFTTRFTEDAARKQAIATYRAALEITPEFSENGNVAVFQLDQGFIKLSRMADGKWGFHL